MTPSEYTMAFVRGNDYFEGNVVDEGKDMWVPTNKRYPHIHMQKGFTVYSKTSSNHMYLISGSDANRGRTERAFEDCMNADIMQICRYILSQFCD